MVLALTSQHIAEMSAHAERVYPEECCGLMVGKIDGSHGATDRATDSETYKLLIELVPLENDWHSDLLAENSPQNSPENSPENESDVAAAASGQSIYTKHRRYAINPKDILLVQKRARGQGLTIIGVYHSHPDHVAVPSECDRAQAWPEYAYVIVSVQGGSVQGKESGSKAVDIQNWTLNSEHQFQPEAMQVSRSSAPDQVPMRMPISA